MHIFCLSESACFIAKVSHGFLIAFLHSGKPPGKEQKMKYKSQDNIKPLPGHIMRHTHAIYCSLVEQIGHNFNIKIFPLLFVFGCIFITGVPNGVGID